MYGVATNESVWSIEKGSHTYDLRSCTTYTYQYVSDHPYPHDPPNDLLPLYSLLIC